MPDMIEVLFSTCSEQMQVIARRARALILDVFPGAIEMPDERARLIGYGTDRTYRGLVCGIALQREYVNLMFARGTELPDPAGLLKGTGKRARHVKLRTAADVDSPDVSTLLRMALKLHHSSGT